MRKWAPIILAVLLTTITCLSVQSAPSRPADQQVVPDGREYIDSAQHVAAGDGFVTTFHSPVPMPPQYSPGYPFALAPFAAVKDYRGIQIGQTVIAMLYVLAIVLAAWSLAGANAASFAAVLVLLSPFARTSSTLIMSDAFGAVLPLLVIPLMRFRTAAGDRLSGALLGYAATVRISAGIALIAALIAAGDRRSRIRIFLWSLPFLGGLLLLQWAMYGNPLSNGYDDHNVGFGHMFSLSNPLGEVAKEGLWMIPEPFPNAWVDRLGPSGAVGAVGLPNLLFYPAVLLGIVWIFIPPLVGVIGLVYGWRHRADQAVRYIAMTAGGSVVFYLFYDYQGARMIAVSGAMLVVLTAAGMARGVAWMGRLERLWNELAARDDAVGADPAASVEAKSTKTAAPEPV